MACEIVEGYFDGLDPNSPEPSDNRRYTYRHGFANGRDDLNGSPRAPAYVLRAMAIAAKQKDKEN